MSHSFLSKSLSIMLVTVVAGSLAGCNLQDTSAPSGGVTPALRGMVMGGETPIEGAHVILWQTSSGGYGSNGAVQLATATTLVGGGFSFTPGYTCASGQFVYLTSTGGDVANNPSSPIVNNNLVLMAALGSCSNFANSAEQANVDIMVNELSTVAAAFTLDNFITVNQNTGAGAGNQLVYVGAPANNNAATGSCTGTGSSMTCVAAGLAHAFANAANLVNDVNYNGTAPTGTAYTTVPKNSLASIPQAEVNALGDIMQYCTNSAGGVAGDSSNCGNFFTDATPVGGTAPTDTLSAMINVAQNPRNNVGSTCTGSSGGLFCLLPSSGAAFQPVLSTVPHDWSLAITYTGLVVGSTSSNWGASTTYFPEWVALDANDNVYVLAGSANVYSSSPTSTTAAMTSNGTGIWANAPSVDGTQGCYPFAIAVDTNGFVWTTYAPTGSQSTCTGIASAIYGRSAATGGAATYTFTSAAPYSIEPEASPIAFDRYNNLWYARDTSSGSTMMYQLPYSAGSYSAPAVTLNGTGGTPAGKIVSAWDILIDANANVYVSNYSSSVTGAVYVIPNLTPTSTPSYSGAATYFTQALQADDSGAIGLDSSGNIWAGAATGEWSEITPTVASGVITGLGSPTNITVETGTTTASKTYPGQIDGAGTFWFPSYSSSGQIWYTLTGTSSTTPTSSYVYPCYAAGGATTCSANGFNTIDPRMLQIDSTGAIWVAGSGSSLGSVVQVLGPAAPLWPQLSYGVFAKKPL